MTIKVVLVGKTGIGKTDLLQKTLNSAHVLAEQAKSTIGHVTGKKTIGSLDYIFYDIAGQHRFTQLRKTNYSQTHIFLLCFDLTDETSLDWIAKELESIRTKVNEDCKFILVGTKSDEEKKRVVVPNKIEAFKTNHCIEDYVETTAKEEQNNLIKALSKLGEALPKHVYQPIQRLDLNTFQEPKSQSSINSRLLLDIFTIGGGLIGLGLCIAAIATLITLATPIVGICLAATGGFFAVTSTAAYIYKACTEGQEDNESNIVTTP